MLPEHALSWPKCPATLRILLFPPLFLNSSLKTWSVEVRTLDYLFLQCFKTSFLCFLVHFSCCWEIHCHLSPVLTDVVLNEFPGHHSELSLWQKSWGILLGTGVSSYMLQNLSTFHTTLFWSYGFILSRKAGMRTVFSSCKNILTTPIFIPLTSVMANQ